MDLDGNSQTDVSADKNQNLTSAIENCVKK